MQGFNKEKVGFDVLNLMKYISSVTILLFSATVIAEFTAGAKALERGDYQTAFIEFKTEAEQGNVAAQFMIGILYDDTKDYVKAAYWYRKAAENGFDSAQFKLGVMYQKGEGVIQDYAEAIHWYRKAAEQGNAGAQFNLGVLYSNGLGVSQNHKQSTYWFEKAAEQGVAKAQAFLGLNYAMGQGVNQNHAKAIYWLRKSAEQGDEMGREALELYSNVKGTTQENEQVNDWPLQAARQGDIQAQYSLGLMYINGNGFAKNGAEAVYWWRKAAGQGHVKAQTALGKAYYNGIGVTKDYMKALHWFRQSAENGDETAMMLLGVVYLLGEGATKDNVMAYMWLNLATANGNDKAGKLRDDLEKKMTVSQVAQAQKLSREWQRKNNRKSESDSVGSLHAVQRVASGSGFRVDKHGAIMTNHHVVDGCNAIKVDGKIVQVRSVDRYNDLALLQSWPVNKFVRFRAGRSVRIGEEVMVAGYPLRGVLGGGLNIGKGTVSSLAGLGNDSRLLQVSAPVNGGNSGGPLLDRAGRVVGVIVSKVNAVKSAKLFGDIIQGANFAIKASIARSFLDMNDIRYEVTTFSKEQLPIDIAEQAKSYTVLVECWK